MRLSASVNLDDLALDMPDIDGDLSGVKRELGGELDVGVACKEVHGCMHVAMTRACYAQHVLQEEWFDMCTSTCVHSLWKYQAVRQQQLGMRCPTRTFRR